MEKYAIVLIDCIVLMYFIFRLKIFIEFEYKRKLDNDNAVLLIYIYKKWICYKLYIPTVELIKQDELLKFKMNVKTTDYTSPITEKSEQHFKTIYNLKKYPRVINRLIATFKRYRKIYTSFMDEIYLSIQCEKFVWKTLYGSSDAALTAIVTGSLWGIKSNILKKMSNRIRVTAFPEINVIPLYNQQKFESDFQCIFSIRLGNVINATINLLKNR